MSVNILCLSNYRNSIVVLFFTAALLLLQNKAQANPLPKHLQPNPKVTAKLSGWINHKRCIPREGQKICDYTPDEQLIGEDGQRVFSFDMISQAIVDPENDYYVIEDMPQFFADEGYKQCSDYIGPDGRFGKKARLLAKELLADGHSTNRYALFFAKDIPQMDELCPAYNQYFTAPERLKYWIFFLTAIAYNESKCGDPYWLHNPDDVYGESVGDFQLEEFWKKEITRDDHTWTAGRFNRGPGCNVKEPPVHVKRTGATLKLANWKNNLQCTVEIFGSTLYGCYKGNDRVCQGLSRPWSSNGMFWREQRTDSISGEVLTKVSQYPACKISHFMASSKKPKPRPNSIGQELEARAQPPTPNTQNSDI